MFVQDQLIYIQLFLDSLYSSCLLPIHHKWVFAVMNDFAYYDYKTMLLYAISGAFLGSIFNYIAGVLLSYKVHNSLPINRYTHLLFFVLALSCSWLSIVGSFISFICGYLKVSIWYTLPASLFSYVIYYLFLV